MFLLPDLIIIKSFVIPHPIFYFAFLCCFGCISFYYLKLIYGTVSSISSRFIFTAIVFFSLTNFLLISLILASYELIVLLENDEFRRVNKFKIILLTVFILLIITIGWILYIKLLIYLGAETNLTVVEAARKLYDYPKIYQKVVKPIIKLGIHYEALISSFGIALFFLFKMKTAKNNNLGFWLILILISIGGAGIAKTPYTHIRYFYYLYPLMLMFISMVIIYTWKGIKKKVILKVLLVAVISGFFFYQISISWEIVTKAAPGSRQRFSGRMYLDNKTCCYYLNERKAENDYVIAFTRVHELAVYCEGKINACIRPMSGSDSLKEYVGSEYHYVTGSKFFNTKNELKSILNKDIKKEANIWVFKTNRYIRNGFWEFDFINKMSEYTVCQSSDQETSLIKISPQKLYQLLN